MKIRIVRLLRRGSARRLFGLCSTVLLLPCLAGAQPAERQTLHGHVPAVVSRLEPLGRLPATNELDLAICLPLRNQEALTNFLQQLQDPASPLYHHYLTREEFTQRFGPSEQDYQSLVAFASSHNLSVTAAHANRVVLGVQGAVADIESAFHVTLRVYQHPKEARTFFAPDSEPSLDLAVPVLRIAGLDNYTRPHPRYYRIPQPSSQPKFGSGPGGTYMGKDFRAAYVPGTTLTGYGQVVGLLQFDGYLASDIQAYESLAGLPNVPLENVLLDGFNGAPTGSGGEVEVSLDIEMSISMAPGLSKVMVYMAGPFGLPEDIINRMASDNQAKIISCSWGWGGGPSSVIDQVLQEMIAQGQTFFDASGDSDAFPPGAVDDPNSPNAPSDDPYMTQVGGTTLTTSGPVGSWLSETVWNVDPVNGVGSCGGISSFYPLPTWQQGIDMTANQGSTTNRNLPDVALTADNVLVIADNGMQIPVGGTSCASPLWAGFTALVDEQAAAGGAPPVGFLNPALYAIGKGSNYDLAFHDITTGNNEWSNSPTLFSAVTGYDLCTGWGTPAGTNLINLLSPPVPASTLVVSSNTVSGGNGNGLIDPNECNNLSLSLVNIGSLAGTGIHTTLASSTPGVVIAQSVSAYPDIPPGGSAPNLTPFQVSTSPLFVCGTPVVFTLTVKSDQGTATDSFTIQTGPQSITNRFDNDVPYPLLTTNLAGTLSPIVVSNISTYLNQVIVSLDVVYPYDEFLQLSLIGPDGTTCLLSANNGGFNANYGIGCSPDTARTTFNDDATTLIANAYPPFAGTFVPDEPLAVFAGKVGTNVNGTWQLQVVDQAGLGVGSIQCWSLMLASASCTDGGGTCPGVDLALGLSGFPDPVFLGSNLVYTITVTNNGPSVAKGVTVTQLLPSSAIFLYATASQGETSFSGGSVSGNLGTIPIGGTATVTVTVIPTAAGVIFSSANVTSIETELNPANNNATIATLVSLPASDLAVGLAAAPNPALVGGVLTYSVSVTNFGPSVASGVTVTNLLPSSVSFISGTPSQGVVSLQPGNVAVCSFGVLGVNRVATANLQVSPIAPGTLTATAIASANQHDPLLGNNTAVVNTVVGPAADLAVTMQSFPNPVVQSGPLNYLITVVNNGPSSANPVTLTGTLPGSVTVVSNFVSQGSLGITNNTLYGNLGFMPLGASATIALVVTPTALGTNVASVTVAAPQADPNPANNTATTTTVVATPFISISPAGAQLLSEGFSPPDGAIDIGETVTLNLSLANTGNVLASNITATLLPGNGVTQIVNPTQSYGSLLPSFSQSAPFTFTAAGTNGGVVVATLQVTAGGGYSTNVSFTFPLPGIQTFANTNLITIPDSGPGTPYPSRIHVAGVTGQVSKLTATLSDLSHTYPHDINVLLVGPSGADTILMSHVADQTANLTDVTLTFDDAAASPLPQDSDIFSGTWQPTAFSPPTFPTNAPAGPYPVAMSVFNGLDPNGTWSLYVYDDSPGDQGQIADGWSLAVTTINPINQLADLSVTGTQAPTPLHTGDSLVCTYTITNAGPNMAQAVFFTNYLPAAVALVSVTNSQGSYLTTPNYVVASLGNLSTGAVATVTLVMQPTANGWLTNLATVSSSEVDLHLTDNSVTLAANVVSPYADLGLVQSVAPNPALVDGGNVTFTITVTNAGPNTALGVLVTNSLPAGFAFVSASSTLGSITNTGGTVVANVGSLNSGSLAAILVNAAPVSLGGWTNLATVTSLASIDTNSANNSASVVVTNLSPVLAAGAKLVSESFLPPNDAVDPGENVTIAFSLANAGLVDLSNVVATLQASGGIASPGPAQNYGLLQHGGASVSRNFSFIGGTPVGGVYLATLSLLNGTNNIGSVTFTFFPPSVTTLTNSDAIVIPDHGAAAPYPALLNVSGLAGVVGKVILTLNGLTHSFPSDVNALLVNPVGNSALLMSHTGGGYPVSNIVLTFDDAAPGPAPANTQLIDGSVYEPSAYGRAFVFPGAPPAPYGSKLAALNGAAPNGTWSLYVFDDAVGNSGNIASGWTLNITTVQSISPVADLAVTMTAAPNPLFQLSTLTYSITVSNRGPSSASGVVLTDVLPAGQTYINGSSSQGTVVNAAGHVTLNVGGLASGTGAAASISVAPALAGTVANVVNAALNEVDLNPGNNTAQVNVSVLVPAPAILSIKPTGAQFEITITAQPGQTYSLQYSTVLNPATWHTLQTTQAPSNGVMKYVTNGAQSAQLYYRAVRIP